MSEFAKIENGKVLTVVTIEDAKDSQGEAFLNSLGLVGTWVQTDISGVLWGKYAGIGDNYIAEKNRFEPPKPDETHTWSEEQYRWLEPEPAP